MCKLGKNFNTTKKEIFAKRKSTKRTFIFTKSFDTDYKKENVI